MLPPPKYILVSSPGRSGTLFLSQVFATCRDTTSEHEPQPHLLSSYHYSQTSNNSECSEAVALKAAAIQHSRSSSGSSTYCITDHTLLHGSNFEEVISQLKLATSCSDDEIAIVVSKRPAAKVVRSRAQLKHGTAYKKNNQTMYRGVGWIYTPSSPLSNLAPPSDRPDSDLTQFEILAGYVLSAQKVGDMLLSNKTTSGLRVYDIHMHEFSSSTAVRKMLHFLNLTFDESSLNKIIAAGKVNERSGEKQEKKAQHNDEDVPTDITFYETIINNYKNQITT
ncbi:hypothetical protein TrVE_jg4638 [Triparma verrucosa]|uniref:Sulfotransferase n=1 Tax=Triparma verrucosa TaxID=1606542 RepID=A0A9W7C8F7_9STRA|nr:hypothetical protein TrVE_jg4638 [Triparma verrucosa]